MRKIIILCFLMLHVSILSAQLVVLKEEQTLNLHSDSLNRDQKIFIRLPKNYDQVSTKYPVVYLFDANDKTLFNYTVSVTDRLMWTHDIPDVILVGIAQNDRSKELGVEKNEVYSNKFLSFIKDELQPEIRRRYRTLEFPVLIGHSLGGQFVTSAMISYPETFKAVISISGALNYTLGHPSYNKGKTLFRLNDFLKRPAKTKMFYYYSVGDSGFQDELFQTGILQVDSLFKKIQPANIDWKFDYLHGFNHGTTPLLSIPAGLQYIFRDWHFSERLAMSIVVDGKTDPLEAVIAKEKSIKDQYGAAIQLPLSIYEQLADYTFEKADLKKAKVFYEKVILINVQNHYPYGQLARIYEKKGDLKKALNYYNLAISKLTTEDKLKAGYLTKIAELSAKAKL